MLISGVIYIKKTAAKPRSRSKPAILTIGSIGNPIDLKNIFSEGNKTPLGDEFVLTTVLSRFYHQVNPIILFYNVISE